MKGKQLFLILSCLSVTFAVHAQDTMRRVSVFRDTVRMPERRTRVSSDTTRIVVDEQGKRLWYREYRPLLGTGRYALRARTNTPDDRVNTTWTLHRLTEAERERGITSYLGMAKSLSPVLQKGQPLNMAPLENLRALLAAEVSGKVLLIAFWKENNPLLSVLPALDSLVQGIGHKKDLLALSLTPVDFATAKITLAKYPFSQARLITSAGQAMTDYQVNSFPTFVVMGKDGLIRFSCSGTGGYTVEAIRRVLISALEDIK